MGVPKKPIPISEKIDKFAQKIKEVQEREREEEERERKEKEKQKREEEANAAKVKSPAVSAKAKKVRDEYTTDDASELSLGETDPEQSELSPNTTSDAASVRGDQEKEK